MKLLKRVHKILFIFLYFFISTLSNYAQNISVTTTINKKEITIGDAIELKIKTTYNPTQVNIHLPIIADTFNHFELFEKTTLDTTIQREKNTITQTIFLSNYDSGVWKIPAFFIEATSLQNGKTMFQFSDSISIKVNTVPIEEKSEPLPIKDIVEAKMPLKLIILYVGLILALLVFLFFLIRFLLKMMKENKIKKLQPKEPIIKLQPHEIALNKLQQIEQQQLWQNQQEKKYHTLLTDTIKTYLEQQFDMDCFEKTSSELMQQIKKQKALSNSRQAFRTIFETADLVKFAKNKPSEEEHQQSIALAKEIIEESYKKFQNNITTSNEPSYRG